MIKILFVCHGNICRSPMAEYVLKDMVKKKGKQDQYQIDSCATSREEIGNGLHRGTRRKLEEEGIPYGVHHARQITQEDYKRNDYILCMDASNLQNIKRIIREDPQHKIHLLLDYSTQPRAIADPWYTGDFDQTYKDIVEGCDAFLRMIDLTEA